MTRVLIVEDEVFLRDALSRILNGMDCEVTPASDGLQAQAELAQTRFDLIVADLSMPHADGFEVLRYAREQRPETPVLIMSGKGSTDDCLRALREGAFNYLSKPFHPAELRQVVRDALRHRSSMPAREETLETHPRPPALALLDALPPLDELLDDSAHGAAGAATQPGAGADSAFAVPVARLPATLILLDGSRSEVQLSFVLGSAIEDLFEPGDPFLPVHVGGGVRIYARAALACISVPEDELQSDGLVRHARKVRVQLRSGAALEGELRYVMVEGQARVTDVLNEPARSFAVYEDGRVHHIAKAHVLCVDER